MRRKMEAILLALLTAALLAGCSDGEDAAGPLKEVRAIPLESTESRRPGRILPARTRPGTSWRPCMQI